MSANANMGASGDHEAITRKVYEYAYGIDTRDFELYRSIFTDEVTMDFSSYNGVPASTLSADAWVAGVRTLMIGLDATQHMMSNPLVDTDGDRARCRMYMTAEHLLVGDEGDEYYTIGGYYDDTLARGDEGWRITAVTLTLWWRRGDIDMMHRARARGERLLAGER